MKYGYGHFGNLSDHYSKARQGYPQEVLDWFSEFIKRENAEILDLGCGTSISTRQLAESGAKVIGCDSDEQMIKVARNFNDGLEYIVARAEKLPFRDEQFDAVSAFGAFHWFANGEALSEIRRVIRPGGIFFVVNKNDAGDFKEGYRKIIRNTLQKKLPDIKKNYEPEKLLKDSGFADIQIRNFDTSEYFTLEQALEYAQSVSMWNEVPDEIKPATLALLENYCREKMDVDGNIERKINIKCVIGRTA